MRQGQLSPSVWNKLWDTTVVMEGFLLFLLFNGNRNRMIRFLSSFRLPERQRREESLFKTTLRDSSPS